MLFFVFKDVLFLIKLFMQDEMLVWDIILDFIDCSIKLCSGVKFWLFVNVGFELYFKRSFMVVKNVIFFKEYLYE